MQTRLDLMPNPRPIQPVGTHRGDRHLIRAEWAPDGSFLCYYRHRGEPPPRPAETLGLDGGWGVLLDGPELGLGDGLLALATVRGLAELTGCDSLIYFGPRPELMQRCDLPLRVSHRDGRQFIGSTESPARVFEPNPGQVPTTWLDRYDEELVQVHASLPMRYYLWMERASGRRLPAPRDPAPRFRSESGPDGTGHVVLVTTSSAPESNRYSPQSFLELARELTARSGRPLRVSVVGARGHQDPAFAAAPVEVHVDIDAADCVDLFAGADVVIGNDTGLTHLAALVERPDGSAPQVVSIYSEFSYAKYTTGRPCHHAISTPRSQALALTDRRVTKDGKRFAPGEMLSADLAAIPPAAIADFAATLTGWQ